MHYFFTSWCLRLVIVALPGLSFHLPFCLHSAILNETFPNQKGMFHISIETVWCPTNWSALYIFAGNILIGVYWAISKLILTNYYDTFILYQAMHKLNIYEWRCIYMSYEPTHDKTSKMTAPSEDSAWASAQTDQSLRYALNGKLRTKAFFMWTAKTLIRLGGCTGWSESSLGANAILLVLSWGGSYVRTPRGKCRSIWN